MTSSTSLPSIEAYLSKIALPAIPEVAFELIKTLDSDDYHLDTVASVIERDPVITATVLRQANSARYGMPMRVENVSDALRVLGMKNVRSIALAASVADAFKFPVDLSKDHFWTSCELAANYSQKVCELSRGDKYTAWLVGFVMRVGEIMIAQIDPAAIRVIEQLPVQPGARWQREATIFGLTEGAFVSALADSWNFPTRVVNSLKHVASPVAFDVAFFEEAGAAHIGALLSDLHMANVTDLDEVASHIPSPVLEALGLEASSVLKIYKN